jgi:hypothetical protein
MTVLLAAMMLTQAVGAPQPRAANWTHTFDAPIVAISDEHAGDCFAVLTREGVSVFSYGGRKLWERDFARLGRYFSAEGIALASDCSWVALAGTSAYKYVWVLERGGSSRYASLAPETPTAVAIAPQGDVIAVATGAERIHLIAPGSAKTGTVLRSHAVIETNLITNTLAFTPDGRRLIPTFGYGAAVWERDGKAVWLEPGMVCRMSPVANASWTLSSCEPPHFSSQGTLTARAADGKVLWEKTIFSLTALGSASGTTFATGEPRQTPEPTGAERLMVIGRDGKVTANLPRDPDLFGPIGVADDGSRALFRRRQGPLVVYSSEGKLLSTIPLVDELSRLSARRNVSLVIGFSDANLGVFGIL